MSSSPRPDAATIASLFLSKFQFRGPQIRTQLLDANQLHLLTLTLNRPDLYPSHTYSQPQHEHEHEHQHQQQLHHPPKDGTPLPPGYHLVYFTPSFLESDLGADGTDTSYNPSAPFTRRMWAGGEVIWPRRRHNLQDREKPNLLRVGQLVTETTRVVSAEAKTVRKTGEEMIVVGVEKRFANEEGVAVIDRRNWVFREALQYPPPPTTSISTTTTTIDKKTINPQEMTQEGRTYKRPLRQTPVSLFRFSALTFNPHKIHYSVPWSRDIEGHRNIVVHGPLNLINMLDLWRDVQCGKGLSNEHDGLEWNVPSSVVYRATNPLYADEDYEIVLDEVDDGLSNVNIYNHEGVVSMKADIKA